MSNHKVLFVLTGHDRLGAPGDGSAEKTGFHLSEAAKPWAILSDAGFEIDIVTPRGGPAPVDPSSRNMEEEENIRFLGDAKVRAEVEHSRALPDVELDDYDGIYFPGGHGTMWDLPENEAVKASVRRMFEDGKLVAAVCHGPAALVNVQLSDGSWLVKGRTISAFTDSEERATEKASSMPFLLSAKLSERGAHLKSADNFESSVSIDGNLITGQNPASAQKLGEAIRDFITERARKAA